MYSKFIRGPYPPVLTYKLDVNIKDLDYTLTDEADTYIFSEIEEYTYITVMLLKKKYPYKPIYFLDEKISYFSELQDLVTYIECGHAYKRFSRERCLWIISDGRMYEGIPMEYYKDNVEREESDFFDGNWNKMPADDFTNVYNSTNVLYSMC